MSLHDALARFRELDYIENRKTVYRSESRRGLDEDRKAVGASIRPPYKLNAATTPLRKARAFAEAKFKEAGLSLDEELPDFDRNYTLLNKKMGSALDIPRKDMPVIDPGPQTGEFEKRLRAGHIDIFKPLAKPQLGGRQFPRRFPGKQGEVWVTLGVVDGDPKDDVIAAQIRLVSAKDLLPLQSEIWYDKLISEVLTWGKAAPGAPILTKKTVIVSKEGYILDGHHRFGQAILADPSLKMRALYVPLDIKTLLKVGVSFGAAKGNAPRA